MIASLRFAFGLTGAAFLVVALLGQAARAESLMIYIGTYTGQGTGSKGIYRTTFDTATGALSEPRLAAELTSPSFLAIDPSGKYLFAVNEVEAFEGKKGGAVSSFAIDRATGDLKPLNSASTRGGGPCHIVVDKEGRHALVANYGGGSTAVVAVDAAGSLGDSTAFFQHTGSSVNPARQKEPHAHSINLDAANHFAFVADLGLDQILVYKFDPRTGTLEPNTPPYAKVAPGAGPRHFAFSPDGKNAYAINELNSTVTAFNYDAAKGVLTEIEAVSTLPKGFRGTNYPADIHVHPSGKFVYGSNRGHDSIVAYQRDPATGKLTYVGTQGEAIKNPRNFAIDPSGAFVLVANQDANSIVVFRIDPATGALSPTSKSIKAPRPVCLQFLPAGQ